MNRKTSLFGTIAVLASVVFATIASAATASGRAAPIVVDSVAELTAALDPANAGRVIRLRAGTYSVGDALTVPDGATLEGEGVMLGRDLPTGFATSTASRIVALPSLTGNVVTLGDGASLRKVAIEDAVGRVGSVVAVVSEEPGDSHSAAIVESEIVTPNPAGLSPDGPTGTAVVAVTRNPALGSSPAPHVGAAVSVDIRRTIVRANDGRGVFAANFASDGRVRLTLRENVVGGSVEAIAGVSRPDPVSGAAIDINSRGNLYGPAAAPRPAWQLMGGTSTPNPLGLGASHNSLNVSSSDDRLAGVRTGILAIAGLRPSPAAGMSSDNLVELSVRGLTMETTGPGAGDLVLLGTLSTVGGSPGEFPAGDRNVVKVDMRDTAGSGPRANVYAHVAGPILPENTGTGNQLVFDGSSATFAERNQAVEPVPPAHFFTEG